MIDQFIAMTRSLIARDGFDGYLPTLLLPARKDVRVLEGAPSSENVRTVVTDWVNRTVKPEEDFIVAYKIDSRHFTVISRLAGTTEERTCETESG